MGSLLAPNLGSVQTLDGSAFLLTRKDEAGHAIYGPYASLVPGIYEIRFQLARRPGTVKADVPCAILDVTCNGASQTLVERALYPNDIGEQPKDVSLIFVLREPVNDLEYRVEVTAQAALLIGTSPQIMRLSGVLDRSPDGDVAASFTEVDELAADTCRIIRFLSPRRLKSVAKVRLGGLADGGYVGLDDFEGIDTAFSFGICDDISWDLDAADRGLRVYQYDHTVADPAPNDERMLFERKRIDVVSSVESQSLSDLIRAHDRGADRPNIILKTDIEGAEWPVIDATSDEELARIAWIVGEFHYFQGLAEKSYRALLERCLSKLSRTFCPVHIHANIFGGVTSLTNVTFPNVLEITFANRHIYNVVDEVELFPTTLDRSCSPAEPDLYLGAFRF